MKNIKWYGFRLHSNTRIDVIELPI